MPREVGFSEKRLPRVLAVGQMCVAFFKCSLEEKEGESSSYPGFVVVALQGGRQARNVQGSLSVWTPSLLYLDRFLLQMSLQTRLLLAWLAELRLKALQRVCG
nr:hypothetical protein CFP56_52330 [Quercus suber]